MDDQAESRLGRAYRVVYETLCGRQHTPYPWHFQWLPLYYLRRNLRPVLAEQGGRVLDVGCGRKPYEAWLGHATEYVGLDIFAGEKVDVVVSPESAWPLQDGYFDTAVSFQALEHARHPEITLAELQRVIRPGGVMVLSFPFMFNEHMVPNDYRRYSAYGACELLPDCDVVKVVREGGIGSTLAILLLNWIEGQANLTFAGRIAKGLLLPIWMPFCLLINGIALVFDRIDRTQAFYSNVLAVYRKR